LATFTFAAGRDAMALAIAEGGPDDGSAEEEERRMITSTSLGPRVRPRA
jgi:hypothetical protein